jgi:hypothetical protein
MRNALPHAPDLGTLRRVVMFLRIMSLAFGPNRGTLMRAAADEIERLCAHVESSARIPPHLRAIAAARRAS